MGDGVIDIIDVVSDVERVGECEDERVEGERDDGVDEGERADDEVSSVTIIDRY